MRKTNISRMTKSIFLVSAMGITGSSQAQLLNFNIPDSIVQAFNQIQEVVRQIESIEHEIAQLDQSGELFNLGVENENNAAAAGVAYRNEMDVDRHEAAVILGDAAADKDACSTVSSALSQKKATATKETKRLTGSEANKSLSSSLGLSESEQMEKEDEINTAILGTCEKLQHKKGESGNIDKSTCLNTNYLFSGNSVMTADQSKATDMMIKIVNDVNVVPTDPSLMMQDTRAAREAKMKYMKKVAMKQIASDGMKDAIIDREPMSDGVSQLASLMAIDEARFGDPSWLAEIGNADPSSKNEVLIETISRKQLALDAFAVHLMMLNYKKMNNQLIVQSAQLTAMNEIIEELQRLR